MESTSTPLGKILASRRQLTFKKNGKKCKPSKQSKNSRAMAPYLVPSPISPKNNGSKVEREDPMYAYAHRIISNKTVALPEEIAEVKRRIPSHSDHYSDIMEEDDKIPFVYCVANPSPPCRFQNPYWIQLSPASEAIIHGGSEYYTLSSRGVTRIFSDKGEVEFTDLDTWLFEKSVFDRIVNMSCVSRIRTALLFYRWKDNIYGVRFRAAKKFMEVHSLQCHSICHKALLDIRKECLSATSFLFIRVYDHYSYSKDEFMDSQLKHVQSNLKSLATLSKVVCDITLRACNSVGMENGGFTARDFSLPNNDRQLRRLRILTRFIRLADYLLLETLVTVVMHTLYSLEQLLSGTSTKAEDSINVANSNVFQEIDFGSEVSEESDDKLDKERQKDLLYVYIRPGTKSDPLRTDNTASTILTPYEKGFQMVGHECPVPLLHAYFVVNDSSDGISLYPERGEWGKAIHTLINHYLSAIDEVERVIENAAIQTVCSTFVSPTVRWNFGLKSSRVKHLLYSYPPFVSLMNDISHTLEAYFSQIEHMAHCKQFLIEVLQKATSNKSAGESLVCNKTLVAFQEQINYWSTNHHEFSKMELYGQAGCFLLDLSPVLGTILPVMGEILQILYSRLTLALKEMLDDLRTKIDTMGYHLTKVPESLDDYLPWLSMMNRLDDGKKDRIDIEHQCEMAATLFKLLRQWNTRSAKVLETPYLLFETRHRHLMEAIKEIPKNRKSQAASFFQTINDRLERIHNGFDDVYYRIQQSGLCDVQKDWVDEKRQILHDVSLAKEYHEQEVKMSHLESLFTKTEQPKSLYTTNPTSEILSLLDVRENIEDINVIRAELWAKPVLSLDALIIQRKVHKIQMSYVQNCENIEENDSLLLHLEKGLNQLELVRKLVRSMTNPSVREAQWNRISALFKKSFQFDPTTTKLQVLMENLSVSEIHESMNICDTAAKEDDIHASFTTVVGEISSRVVALEEFKHSYILSDLEGGISFLEKCQNSLSHLIHKESIWLPEVTDLYNTTITSVQTLRKWQKLQEHWITLSQLLSLHSVKKSREDEWKKFYDIDKEWRTIMRDLHSKECRFSEIVGRFSLRFIQDSIDVCDNIKTSLQSVLSEVREAFPRFFLVSDSMLIQLLINQDDCKILHVAATRCFPNVESLVLERKEDTKSGSVIANRRSSIAVSDKEEIIGMRGFGNTLLPFNSRIKRLGSLTYWFGQVESSMRQAIKKSLINSLQDDDENACSEEWCNRYIPQVLFTATHVSFCTNIASIVDASEGTLNLLQLDTLQRLLNSNTKKLTTLVEFRRRTHNKELMFKAEGLILLIQQHEYVLRSFGERESLIEDYSWDSTLKIFHSGDNLVAKFGHMKLNLGYEFTGQSSCTVVTPSTQRFYFSIATAVYYQSCVAPYGPTESGKSTMINSIGNSLMRLCLTLYCTKVLEETAIFNYIRGTAQVGAWSCISGLLSAGAHILTSAVDCIRNLQKSIMLGKRTFDFNGKLSQLSTSIKPAIFLLGSSQSLSNSKHQPSGLPDFLRSTFRPTAIAMPDKRTLLRALLNSRGFSDPTLGDKLFHITESLQEISKESKRVFSLSLLKKTIRFAAEIYQNEMFSIQVDGSAQPYRRLRGPLHVVCYRDTNILRCAIQKTWMPHVQQLSIESEFKRLCDRYIPAGVFLFTDSPIIEEALHVTMKHYGLECTETFVKKSIELYESVLLHTGTIMSGDAGTGKTTSAKALLSSISMENVVQTRGKPSRSKLVVINPHVLSTSMLYGYTDEKNNWNCGVVECILSLHNRPGTGDTLWILFEGPISGDWVDHCKTLIKESSTLFLPNGEYLPTPQRLRILFEVTNLSDASPKFVSNCGLVHYNETSLVWKSLIYTWVVQKPDSTDAEKLRFIMEGVLESCGVSYYNLLRTESMPERFSTLSAHVTNTLQLFNSLSGEVVHSELCSDDHVITALALLATAWGFGAHLNSDQKKNYSDYLNETVMNDKRFFDIIQAAEIDFFNVTFNFNSKAFETFSVYEGIEATVGGASHIVEAENPGGCGTWVNHSTVIVRTAELYKREWLAMKSLAVFRSVLIFGSMGCGKSSLLKLLATRCTKQRKVIDFLNDSPNFEFSQFLSKVAVSDKSVVFLDDISLDSKPTGSRIELLRHLMDQKGAFLEDYSRGYSWSDIDKCFVMCVKGNPLKETYSRFLRHSFFIEMDSQMVAEVTEIFSEVMQHYVRLHKDTQFPIGIQSKLRTRLLSSSVSLLFTLQSEACNGSHLFDFSISDLSHLFRRLFDQSSSAYRTILGEDNLVPESVWHLWRHECKRVFRDRLQHHEARQTFDACLDKMTELNVKKAASLGEETLPHHQFLPDSIPTMEAADKSLRDHLISRVESKRQECARWGDVQVTTDLTKHFVNILKAVEKGDDVIIPAEEPSALRLGILHLIADFSDASLITYHVDNSTNAAELKSFMAKCTLMAGIDNKRIIVFFERLYSDSEDILLLIKDYLSHKYPMFLETTEYREKVQQAVRSWLPLHSVQSDDELKQIFMSRVYKNLTIVCSLEKKNSSTFRTSMTYLTEGISSCYINWLPTWTTQELREIVYSKLEPVLASESTSIEKLSKLVVELHLISADYSVEVFYKHKVQTPSIRTLLQFTETFLAIYDHFEKQIAIKKNTFEQSKTFITEFLAEFERLKLLCTEAKAKTLDLKKKVADIETDIEVHDTKYKATKVRNDKNLKALDQVQRKLQAQRPKSHAELENATTHLQSVTNLVNNANKVDLAEISEFGDEFMPMNRIALALCAVIKAPAVTVENGLSFLKSDTLSQNVKSISDNGISTEMRIRLKSDYMAMAAADGPLLKRRSKFLSTVLTWLLALCNLQEVKDNIVQRKKDKELHLELYRKLEGTITTIQTDMDIEAEAIRTLKAEKAKASSRLETASKNEQRIETDFEKMVPIRQLITSAKTRVSRWENCFKAKAIDRFCSVALLSAEIVYLGPFNKKVRTNLRALWKDACKLVKIRPCVHYKFISSGPLSLLQSTESEVWNRKHRLLDNNQVLESAVMVEYSQRVPLLLDAEGIALPWLISALKCKALLLLSATGTDVLEQLHVAQNENRAVILTDFSAKHLKVFAPFLIATRKQLLTEKPPVATTSHFQMYLVTTNKAPFRLPEEYHNMVNVITFSGHATELKLLRDIVQSNNQSLLQQFYEYQSVLVDSQCLLEAIEAEVFDVLDESGDKSMQEMICSLYELHKKQQVGIEDVSTQLSKVQKVNVQMEESFRPLAQISDGIFRVTSVLQDLNKFYTWSFAYYQEVVQTSLKNYKDIGGSVETQRTRLATQLYSHFAKAIMDRHQVLFDFLVAIVLDDTLEAVGGFLNSISDNEWKFLTASTFCTKENVFTKMRHNSHKRLSEEVKEPEQLEQEEETETTNVIENVLKKSIALHKAVSQFAALKSRKSRRRSTTEGSSSPTNSKSILQALATKIISTKRIQRSNHRSSGRNRQHVTSKVHTDAITMTEALNGTISSSYFGSPVMWKQLKELESVSPVSFNGLYNNIRQNFTEWDVQLKSMLEKSPIEIVLPACWTGSSKISAFHKLLIVKAIFPIAFGPAVEQYVGTIFKRIGIFDDTGLKDALCCCADDFARTKELGRYNNIFVYDPETTVEPLGIMMEHLRGKKASGRNPETQNLLATDWYRVLVLDDKVCNNVESLKATISDAKQKGHAILLHVIGTNTKDTLVNLLNKGNACHPEFSISILVAASDGEAISSFDDSVELSNMHKTCVFKCYTSKSSNHNSAGSIKRIKAVHTNITLRSSWQSLGFLHPPGYSRQDRDMAIDHFDLLSRQNGVRDIDSELNYLLQTVIYGSQLRSRFDEQLLLAVINQQSSSLSSQQEVNNDKREFVSTILSLYQRPWLYKEDQETIYSFFYQFPIAVLRDIKNSVMLSLSKSMISALRDCCSALCVRPSISNAQDLVQSSLRTEASRIIVLVKNALVHLLVKERVSFSRKHILYSVINDEYQSLLNMMSKYNSRLQFLYDYLANESNCHNDDEILQEITDLVKGNIPYRWWNSSIGISTWINFLCEKLDYFMTQSYIQSENLCFNLTYFSSPNVMLKKLKHLYESKAGRVSSSDESDDEIKFVVISPNAESSSESLSCCFKTHGTMVYNANVPCGIVVSGLYLYGTESNSSHRELLSVQIICVYSSEFEKSFAPTTTNSVWVELPFYRVSSIESYTAPRMSEASCISSVWMKMPGISSQEEATCSKIVLLSPLL